MGLTQVSTSGIKDATIATADIADDAVTNAKIADGTIVAGNLASNSVTSGQIANNVITDAKINPSAAIAGTKISPNFGSQDITTTGRANISHDLTITGTAPRVILTDTDHNSDFRVNVDSGLFSVQDTSNSNASRLEIGSDGKFRVGCTAQPSSSVGGFQLDMGSYPGTARLSSGAGTSGTDSASLQIAGSNYNASLAHGANSGAALNLINYNTTDGNSTSVSFHNSNSLASARILGVNISHSNRDGALVFMTSDGTYPEERMRLNPDGRLGIGKTASSTLDIETASNANGFNLNCVGTAANYMFNVRDDNVSKFYISNTGSIGVGTDNPFSPTGYATIELNGATGGCLTFSDDDTQKFEIYGSDANLGIYNRTNTKYIAYFHKGGDVELADGNLKLASGHGIDFSATGNGSGTMSNELLDDYEEGTWVPTMTFNGNSTGLVYNQQEGRYTKIGNIVHASFVIGITDKGSSTGNWQIGGLPYSSKNDSGDRINGFVTYYGGMISVNTHISLYNSTNTSNFYGYNGDGSSTSAQNLTHSNVNDSAHLRGHVIYRTT